MKTLKKRLLCDLICVIGATYTGIGLEFLHSVSFVIIGVVVCGYGIYLSWKLVRCPVCDGTCGCGVSLSNTAPIAGRNFRKSEQNKAGARPKGACFVFPDAALRSNQAKLFPER